MNTFLVVFNTENRSQISIDSMNRIVKGGDFDFCPILCALHLSVFLVRTHCDQGQLVARLFEMNDDSIIYWVAEHLTDCVVPQLDQAIQWAKSPSRYSS